MIFINFFISFIPESLRFLYVKGKREQLDRVIAKIARYNRKTVPLVHFTTSADEEKVNGSWLHLFNTRRMTVMTLTLAFVW